MLLTYLIWLIGEMLERLDVNLHRYRVRCVDVQAKVSWYLDVQKVACLKWGYIAKS